MTFLRSRQTSTLTYLLISVSATIFGKLRISLTSRLLNLRITSPLFIPPFAAGLLSVTLATKAPSAFLRPNLSAISSVTFCIRTPSQPRRVLPYLINCPMTPLAIFEGVEKPIPMLPPDGDNIIVLMPITSPSILNKGPPECPLLIEASVWIKSS